MQRITGFILSIALSSAAMAHEDSHNCEHTALGDTMLEMRDAFKALRQAGDDATMLAQIDIMLNSASQSLELTPYKASMESDEAQAAKLIAGYQQGIQELIDQLTALQTAVTEQDKSAQRKLIGSIGQHSKQSHGDYKYDC